MKNKHEIEVVLKGKEWSDVLDATFKKKQKEVKVDGFRKGSIPKDMFIKKFGIESLYGDSIDGAINIAYKKALKDSKLIPVVEPAVDVTKIDEKEVTFKFTIITTPEVKLGKYKNFKIKQEKPEATKEEIDKEVEALKSKLAEIVIKEKGKVEDWNTAVIDFEGVVDGEVLEGGSGTDYPLEIGSNTFIPGFESSLIGMKVGETKSIDLEFPEDYTPELRGKKVSFKVTIKAIKERVLPEINEDFYKDLGFEKVKNEKEFRKEVEKTILSRKEVQLEDKYIEECLAASADNMKVEINEEIISEEIMRMMRQYEEQLKMQGLSLEQYMQFTGQTKEDLSKSMQPEAEKRIKYRYLLEKVGEVEKIEISDKEAKEEAKKAAKGYNIETDEFIKMIGGLEMMKYDIKMRRAIEIIKGDGK